MAKALKIGALVVGVAALAIVTGGAAAGLGLSLATSAFGVSASALMLASTALSIGSSLLTPKPKAPAESMANADRLNVSIDLRTPRKIALGTTAFSTDCRDQEWSSDQSYLHRFVVTASHRCSAYRQIWFDDKLAWTATGGVQAPFVGYLVVTTVLEGSAANAINIGPRMGSSRRYTGCSYVYFQFKLTGNSKKAESPFAQSIPTRMTIIGDGMPVYDPRLDSTRGGSGPQRANDQTTWAWSDSAGRNPALQLLTHMLGWRIKNPTTGAWKLAVGKGIDPARINIGSFLTAANICDESVARSTGGTEPRYRADGVMSEGDDLSLVADNFKASMNATFDDVDGQFRLSILRNDLAAPLGDLVTADVLGDFTWDQTPPLQDTVNLIRGSYVDPSTTSLYQMVDYPEVRIASTDGIERPQTVNLPLVQSGSQAQRLIKLRLQRALFPGMFTATFQATAWKYQKGDVIRLTFAPMGFVSKLFRIADMTIQVDGTVPMILREEHPNIYLAENDSNAPVVGTAPTVYDPTRAPVIQGLSDLNAGLDATNVVVGEVSVKADTAITKADAAAALAAATKLRIDTLDNDTIPAINQATADANTRIDQARQLVADEKARAQGKEGQLDQRIDAVAASGTYDDTAVKASIEEVRSAYVAADIGFAEKVTTLEASSRADSTMMNANANFSDWPESRGNLPNGWGLAAAGPGSVAQRAPGILGRFKLGTSYGGSSDGNGFFYAVSGLNFGDPGGGVDPGMFGGAGWYVAEADITLDSGSLVGSGLYCASYTDNGLGITTGSGHFADMPANGGNAPGAGQAGKRYHFALLLDFRSATTTSFRLHPMVAWAGFVQNIPAKGITWHRAGLRPATPIEIQTQQVVTTALPDLSARVSLTENALVDGRFATASRAATLEAQMAGSQASNLLSRIQTSETALTDGRFAAASRVTSLETTAGNLTSRVETTEGTIAGLGVRQAAYWRVLAVAGNGRVQLTVSADANGGGGVDILGDLSLSGNLLLGGSVITSAIAENAVTAMVGAQTGGTSYAYGNNGTFYGISVTVPNPTGGPVRVDFRYANTSGGPGGGTFSIQIQRVLPDGSTYDFSDASYIGGIILDYPPAGASVTYRLKFFQQGSAPSGGGMNVLYQQLFAVALKR